MPAAAEVEQEAAAAAQTLQDPRQTSNPGLRIFPADSRRPFGNNPANAPACRCSAPHVPKVFIHPLRLFTLFRIRRRGCGTKLICAISTFFRHCGQLPLDCMKNAMARSRCLQQPACRGTSMQTVFRRRSVMSSRLSVTSDSGDSF